MIQTVSSICNHNHKLKHEEYSMFVDKPINILNRYSSISGYFSVKLAEFLDFFFIYIVKLQER